MSCFFLNIVGPDDPRVDHGPQVAAALAALERRGLQVREVARRDGCCLHATTNLQGDPPVFLGAAADDFALLCGTMIYAGKTGIEALRRFAGDFEPDWSILQDCRGQFSVVLSRGGTWHVGTDWGGFHHVYRPDGLGFLTNSFLAACAFAAPCKVDDESVTERLFLGDVTGTRTVFTDIHCLPHDSAVEIGGTPRFVPKPPLPVVPPRARSFDSAVEEHAAQLKEVYGAIATVWGSRIITPLTGGFDSRLVCAGLRSAGATPKCLVYGPDGHRDIRIAKEISRGEGIELDHVDRSLHPRPSPEELPAVIEESFWIQDGNGTDGVWGDGADMATRYRRAADGDLYVNGSGGEIYRNIWKLRDTGLPVVRFLAHRFSRLDPTVLRDPERWPRMLERLGPSYCRIAGGRRDDRLTRQEIDSLYFRQRMRYWMAPDNQVNTLFGDALTPFVEPVLTEPSLSLPVSWRQYGRFEAALVNRLDPPLARYRSEYGWAMDGPVPWRIRLRAQIPQWLPAHIIHGHQHRQAMRRLATFERPFWFRNEWREAVLGTGPLRIEAIIDLDRAAGEGFLNRALTLELLLREFT